MIKPEQTVASIVRAHSECAEVFQRYHIDYCCRGNMSIEQASANNNIDLSTLLQELAETISNRNDSPSIKNPANFSTPALISHIILIHHEFLRKTLPLVSELSKKVASRHGQHNSNLIELDRVVQKLVVDLLIHLDMEEKSLFPMILSGNIDKDKLNQLLTEMNTEHEEVADMLSAINKLSNHFTPPDDACNSYRTLFLELKYLETDIFKHVYLENHVLAPRCDNT